MKMTRFIRLIQSIVRETFPNYTFLSKYRYRIIQMSEHKLELQAVSKANGLPDTLPIPVWPGMSGLSAKFTPGSQVLVSFIEGSPTMPYVEAFEDRDGAGFLPLNLMLDATNGVVIGTSDPDDDKAHTVARVGDAVSVFIPSTGTAITGTVTTPPPASVVSQFIGTLICPYPLTGMITSGAAKTRAR
jgi:hypothetical protein